MKSNAGERDTNTDSHQILVAFIIKSFRLNEFPLAFVSVTRISTYICIYIYIYKYIDSYSYPIPPTVLGLSPILSSMRKAGSRRAQNKHWLCIFVCDSPAVSSTDMAGNVWHFLRGKLDLVLIRKLLKIIPKRRRVGLALWIAQSTISLARFVHPKKRCFSLAWIMHGFPFLVVT